ncbi:hypothetical protein [Roseateles albus]|uniref:Uncharacterized protein n=1 Tax=Roseateles albus TaxID=2987525 RepID=A0ABT5KBJ2_9BURK|nr:hypothetical protein [Roseateles albus]MDC8771305.1 hypothetical protein [Roseateles albus]
MKRLAWMFLSGLGLLTLAPAQAGDLGVSVSIGQPGFYGHIDIGNAQQPRLIYRQPVVIERVYQRSEPVYMRVPPGHERNWRKHCRQYGACGQNVYFVRDDWYRQNYERQDQWREHGHEHGRGRDDDRDRGHDRGEGRGYGRH